MWREDSSLPRAVYTDQEARERWVNDLLVGATREPTDEERIG